MKTFSINTLGCKVNQYESQQIRELLEKLGLQQAESSESAFGGDLIVINTCCVTHTASAKSRQHIRRAGKLNPDAVVVVSGCLPTVQVDELDIPDDNVHLVTDRTDLSSTLAHLTGLITAPEVSQSAQSCPANIIKAKNDHKSKKEIADCVDQIENRKSKTCPRPRPEIENALPALTSFQGQTRAFLKVQDGCDGYCTYCIVPKTRPFVSSKPLDKALAEAQALVEAGHREIVITGIFLGAYGQDTVRRRNWPEKRNDNLADLLDRLVDRLSSAGDRRGTKDEGRNTQYDIRNTRIRLSSLEPADVTPRLLDTLAKHPNIMPHLHLPLQSGSDDILRKMCRQYRVAQFKETIELVKSRLDRPAITTDIIVGFPGESQEDFERTVNLAREVGFAKIHVFSFSPRKGTAAAMMQSASGGVDKKVIRERSEILHELQSELARKYRQQFLGETAQVLIENAGDEGRRTRDEGRRTRDEGRRTRDEQRNTQCDIRNTRIRGRSERYFMVTLDPRCSMLDARRESRSKNPEAKRNQIINVKLLENHEDGMIGKVICDCQLPIDDCVAQIED
jgi:threonylcarbamoyladenosine tRNA methylthiotransferase MtaB